MILVDTSIWIDHLRSGSPALGTLLENEAVCTHDFVIGELACGNLRNRTEVLGLLQSLPRLSAATEDEALFFIEQQQLMGCGICYIDAHLLAASVIRDIPIWMKGKGLMTIAEQKGRAYARGAHRWPVRPRPAIRNLTRKLSLRLAECMLMPYIRPSCFSRIVNTVWNRFAG